MAALWTQVQKDGGYDAAAAPPAVLLLNENVTKQRLLAAIKDVGKAARPDDVLVLCVAGHGGLFDRLDGFISVFFTLFVIEQVRLLWLMFAV